MKRQDIILLTNLGIQAVTAHTLDAAHAYKVVKFRKAVQAALDAYNKDKEAILKDAGIEDGNAFDDELNKLRQISDRTADESLRLKMMEDTLKRFAELHRALLDDEVTLDCKTMPYAEWHKLQVENKDKEINGRKMDILSGYVEDILEGVLWETPAE